MPLITVRNDITKMETDAIVLPANPGLRQGPGTSRAIYEAAGEKQLEGELRLRYPEGCPMGQAVITNGYKLPAQYVIHAVCPKWRGGNMGERDALYSAYTWSLGLAAEKKLSSIAFPLLSGGNYGYPNDQAMAVASQAITDFLLGHEMEVYLVLYTDQAVDFGNRVFADIREYIDSRYVEEKDESFNWPEAWWREYRTEMGEEATGLISDVQEMAAATDYDSSEEDASAGNTPSEGRRPFGLRKAGTASSDEPLICNEVQQEGFAVSAKPENIQLDMQSAQSDLQPAEKQQKSAGVKAPAPNLDAHMQTMGESFHDMLMRLIEESGMKNSTIYDRAQMSKQQFSKIKNDPDRQLKKKTILSLAIALRLSISTTEKLLRKAGYALSDSSKFDLVVSYFLEHENYDIYAINFALDGLGIDDYFGFN